jgi:hypothetical protein
MDQPNCRLLMLNVCSRWEMLEPGFEADMFDRALTMVLSLLRTRWSCSTTVVPRKAASSRAWCTWVTLTACPLPTSGWRRFLAPTRWSSRTKGVLGFFLVKSLDCTLQGPFKLDVGLCSYSLFTYYVRVYRFTRMFN